MEIPLKASIALVVGAAIAAGAAQFRLWPADSGLSILALPLISWGGYMFLANWAGSSKEGAGVPLLHYSIIVLGAFAVFGVILSANFSPNMPLACVSLALLTAPLVEYGSKFSFLSEEAAS